MQFVVQPGSSFISGEWKNISAYNSPVFQRNFTPALEAGIFTAFNFKSKTGGKIVYDEMYQAGFYLADKIGISIGFLYSLGGQHYGEMKQDNTSWSRNLRLQYFKVPFKIDFVKGN